MVDSFQHREVRQLAELAGRALVGVIESIADRPLDAPTREQLREHLGAIQTLSQKGLADLVVPGPSE